ncbi:MAG: bifunctional DNA-formamidopyrimidine glycosylase/DNA-(apurinic or apyrimidinic site) lyase [Chloroflexota bacterium]
MPELPEVETIKNELSPYILGRTVTGVDLPWEGIVRQPSASEFRSRLIGQKITKISRRGKYLILNLSSSEFLIIHLKMSGALLFGNEASEPPKYTRATFRLDDGTIIFFRDPRKFGVLRLVEDKNSIVGELGPEPLEANFTHEVLAQRLHKRTAPIKALLSDQKVIAGVGNMYADEALFASKIHPLRAGGSLTKDEIKRLHQAIIEVLKSGIGNKGASIENYIRPDGTLGTAHTQFKVAHRRGETCPRCGTPLERIAVRHRGTYFCPKCQRER